MPLKVDNSKGELVIDPYKQKEAYNKHRKEIFGISNKNKTLILQYLDDMEKGKNTTGKRGGRGWIRLNILRTRLTLLTKMIEKNLKKDLNHLTEDKIMDFFNSMKNGKIKNMRGKQYRAINDYVKDFRSYWHWYMKYMRKKGRVIPDITTDLNARPEEKPKFNYLPFDKFKKLTDHAKYDYKVIMWFMFDTGIRSPTELVNVKVKDIEFGKEATTLNIREETSKTFGRKIKLMLCSDLIKKYIKEKKLKDEDFIFQMSHIIINRYIKRLGKRILGIDNLTMYDFRHSSACYWLPKYKSESALKYRFGWKESDMIHYYTEFLGMKDTITKGDLIDDETKTLMQRELDQVKQQNQIMQDRVDALEKALTKILKKSIPLKTK